ncbi:MAG TPA: acyltransferase [Candidatus Binatus sp.]|jgi:peptidoglycan/LPS O-acetylase OafA/YrhL|nr:acyltransferase [Candidatus Binatus sp.]HWY22006.1 acyltransferase [Candidatus Acidoferrum sp.]
MRTSRNQSLDVLRGFAILMVIGRHVPYYTFWGKIGWAGVDLFFVLSGFLISGLLFKEYKLRRAIDFRQFILRRGFKIWPPFCAFMLLIAVPLSFAGSFPARQFFLSLGFLANYVHDNYFVLGHTWSLAVEEHFYILLPLLFSVLIRSKKRQPFTVIPPLFAITAVVCLGLRVGLHPGPGSSYETQFRLDSLFAGVALSYLYHFRHSWFRRLTGHKGLLLTFLFCSPLAFLDWSSTAMQTWGFSSLFVGFALLLAWSVERKPPGILAPLAQIGFFSYSIYLWQQPIAVFFAHRQSFLSFWGYVTICVTVGAIMARIVEQPSLALREKLLGDSPSETDPLRTPLLQESA